MAAKAKVVRRVAKVVKAAKEVKEAKVSARSPKKRWPAAVA